MTVWLILGAGVTATLGIIVFALRAELRRRAQRRLLERVAPTPGPDAAYRAVVNARSAFTRSVQAYEEALGAAGREGSVTTGAADLQVIEQRKDQRRARLMEAQRLWEAARPAPGPDSPVRFWIGAGELRGWSLGVVGFESALIRLEHGLDPDCWVVLEVRRVRLGPAVGVERLRLGLIVEGAHIEQLTGLIQTAMGSPEVALRPGLSVVRMLAERRAAAHAILPTLRAALDGPRSLYADGLPDEVRQEALAHFTAGRAIDLGAPDDGLGHPRDDIRLRIGAAGPSLLIGAWTGRRPAARVVAGSNHQAWVRTQRT